MQGSTSYICAARMLENDGDPPVFSTTEVAKADTVRILRAVGFHADSTLRYSWLTSSLLFAFNAVSCKHVCAYQAAESSLA